MSVTIFGYNLNTPLPYIGASVIEIIIAIVAFLIGYVVVVIAIWAFKKSLKRTKLPNLLVEFLARFLKAILLVFVLLAVLPILHIDVSAIVIGLSAVIGLILGFGLQDTMTNIFSGFWLAMLKPFEIGDYIEVNGVSGALEAVGIMSTTLTTPDNKYIMIPNKLIWGATIINYTKKPVRRVDVSVGISYSSDLNRAIGTAMKIMKENPRVLDEPAPNVVITQLGDSAIGIQLRAWSKTEDYWTVMGEITREILERFRESGIEIPYPQLDVHIKGKS